MEGQRVVEKATVMHNLLITWMVNKLRDEGYDYIAADHISEPIDRPFALHGAIPDIYATRRGWRLLVEVETFESLTGRVNQGNWNIFNREALQPRTEFWLVVSEEDAELAERTCDALGLVKAKVYRADLSGQEELKNVSRKPAVKRALAERFEGKTDLSEIETHIRAIADSEERWKKRDEVAEVLSKGGAPERRPKGYRLKTKRSEAIPFPAAKDFSFTIRVRQTSVLIWLILSAIVSIGAVGLLIFCIIQLVQGTYSWATLGEGLGMIGLIFLHFPFYNRYREELSIMLGS